MSKLSNKTKQLMIKKAGKKYQKKLAKRAKAVTTLPASEETIKFLDKLAKDSHDRWW